MPGSHAVGSKQIAPKMLFDEAAKFVTHEAGQNEVVKRTLGGKFVQQVADNR